MYICSSCRSLRLVEMGLVLSRCSQLHDLRYIDTVFKKKQNDLSEFVLNFRINSKTCFEQNETKKLICHQAFSDFMRYFLNSPYVIKTKNCIKHK